VIVGGVLILFTYITRIASNETFYLSKNLIIISIIIISIYTIIIFIDTNIISQLFKIRDSININYIINFIRDNNLILNKIYNKPRNTISLILINYLFLTLIIVVKITNINYGPLRQKF